MPVPSSGLTDVDISLPLITPLPSSVTVDGQSGTIPTVSWDASTPISITGCPGGLGFVLITGTDAQTDEQYMSYVNLAETPLGSGTYDTTIPPLYPAHGNVMVQYLIDCSIQSALNPASGPVDGGNTVLITGQGFTGATAVAFGTTPAVSFTVLSDTEISAVAPPGAGTVDVDVTTSSSGVLDDSSIASYIYFSVDSVSPSSGAAGNTVTITGTGLSDASTLLFGDTPVQDWSIDSDTQITATVPADSGTDDVTILTGDGGESAPTPNDQFTYTDGTTAAIEGNDSAAVVRTDSEVFPPADKTPEVQAGRPVTPMGEIPGGPEILAAIGGEWASVAKLAQKLLDPAKFVSKVCAADGDLGMKLGAALNETLAEMQKESATGNVAVDGFITAALGAAAVATLETFAEGALATAAATFGPTVAMIAAVLAIAALVQAAPALAKCFPNPPKPPKPPKSCTGKHCKPVGSGKGGSSGGGGFLRIDPSGTVEDTNGNPIDNTTVTLSRSDTETGSLTAVPANSPFIEPNVDPEITQFDGTFHWDVAGGYYQVSATALGCSVPGDSSETEATSSVFPVPPPKVGLVLTLSCPDEPAAPTPVVSSLSVNAGPSMAGLRSRLSAVASALPPK